MIDMLICILVGVIIFCIIFAILVVIVYIFDYFGIDLLDKGADLWDWIKDEWYPRFKNHLFFFYSNLKRKKEEYIKQRIEKTIVNKTKKKTFIL